MLKNFSKTERFAVILLTYLMCAVLSVGSYIVLIKAPHDAQVREAIAKISETIDAPPDTSGCFMAIVGSGSECARLFDEKDKWRRRHMTQEQRDQEDLNIRLQNKEQSDRVNTGNQDADYAIKNSMRLGF